MAGILENHWLTFKESALGNEATPEQLELLKDVYMSGLLTAKVLFFNVPPTFETEEQAMDYLRQLEEEASVIAGEMLAESKIKIIKTDNPFQTH